MYIFIEQDLLMWTGFSVQYFLREYQSFHLSPGYHKYFFIFDNLNVCIDVKVLSCIDSHIHPLKDYRSESKCTLD